VLLLLALVAAACGDGGAEARPGRLLDGEPAAEFAPVDGSVLAVGRIVRRASLGSRIDDCLGVSDDRSVAGDAVVVERVGAVGESLTFTDRGGRGVYACDGGIDPAGERRPPWCGLVFGERESGRLLDPRLDVNCRDREQRALAYAFVEPVGAARWVGVRQKGYVEVYEVLAGLPVRIASAHDVSADGARAAFEISQYDVDGRELLRGDLEAGVAG
jgi:hypothetical protein